MGKKNKTPVVIVGKDKRLSKGAHLAAFLLTGGTSGIVTAAKAGTNTAYNARTRRLQAEAEEEDTAMQAAEQRAADAARVERMRRTPHRFTAVGTTHICKVCWRSEDADAHNGPLSPEDR